MQKRLLDFLQKHGYTAFFSYNQEESSATLSIFDNKGRTLKTIAIIIVKIKDQLAGLTDSVKNLLSYLALSVNKKDLSF